MLVRADWKETLKHLGVTSDMVIILEGSLQNPQQTVGQYNTFLDALLDVITNEGTIVYFMRHDYQNDPSQWDIDVPLVEYDVIKEQLANSTNILPTQDMLANTMLLRDDCIIKRHPAFSVLVIGKYARFITRKIPLHFPNQELSPLQACVDLKGSVLMLNNLSLHSLSFTHVLSNKKTPIVVAGGVMIDHGMARWQKYLDVFVTFEEMEALYNKLNANKHLNQTTILSDLLTLVSLEKLKQGCEL